MVLPGGEAPGQFQVELVEHEDGEGVGHRGQVEQHLGEERGEERGEEMRRGEERVTLERKSVAGSPVSSSTRVSARWASAARERSIRARARARHRAVTGRDTWEVEGEEVEEEAEEGREESDHEDLLEAPGGGVVHFLPPRHRVQRQAAPGVGGRDFQVQEQEQQEQEQEQ